MNADTAYELSAQLITEQKFPEAADAARAGLGHRPEDGRLWQVLGVALWANKDAGLALDVLETATTLAPLRPVARRALADCYVQAGKKELAVLVYRHLIDAGDCPSALLPGVAAALNSLGEYLLALTACRTLADREPEHHQAFFGIAYYLSRLGAPPCAVVAPLAMAMDLAPGVLHYRLNLAFAWADLGNFVKARDLLTPVAVEEVRSPCWLLRMRNIFERAGEHQKALDCLGRLRQVEG
jgi:tetratricopeptide (TPR) repeat protein